MTHAKPWFLYFIECRSGSIYTGIAVDVDARYTKHANGTGAKYTRMNPPLRLLGSIEFANRTAAASAEMTVKRMPATQKRAWIADACG